ncbi:MAG: cobalt-precorrin-5B (C(1))-methyltransferase [Cyanobacteria bacterium K_DeepCast_0m_m1_088]|nr:cobalt-precorrin-5B (C(1))-methyltransferase [Cyanobacteria bacterium K_DeepCast_0m_m1_088]
MSSAAVGYTLPVWVCAAARAALQVLAGQGFAAEQPLQLDLANGQTTAVPVLSAAPLGDGWVLAMARCDPGSEGLDLTRDLPVWTLVRWLPLLPTRSWLQLEAGDGVGVHEASGELCLSAYARDLLESNLRPLVPFDQGLQLRVVLPQGRDLASRTSNAAFGVVDGLALIGTQAVVQRSAAPDQLATARAALAERAAAPGFAGDLVLVIGENGLDLAPRLGLPEDLLLKAGNWIGPLLVAAGEAGVRRLLLFGYQGKLIKLAGGIFHTHHHLADGRAEVLTALAALEGVQGEALLALHQAPTVEQALADLQRSDPRAAQRLRRRLAAAVEQRASAYLARYGQHQIQIGAVLFDRARNICAQGPLGQALLEALAAAPRLVRMPGCEPSP